MRIVSRNNEEQVQLDRLRGIVEVACDGHVTPADNLPALVSQLEDTVTDLLGDIENLEEAYGSVKMEVAGLDAQCAMQEQRLDDLMRIGFDEALDYATLDLMDAFLGTGAATSTFGGDLSFEPGVTFTKQDIKPLLRQAIITWINTKVS